MRNSSSFIKTDLATMIEYLESALLCAYENDEILVVSMIMIALQKLNEDKQIQLSSSNDLKKMTA